MKTSRWLWLLIGLHLGLGFLYDASNPTLEAPDEGEHFAFVHWIAQGHPLPVQDPRNPSAAWAQEGSQPPLYYLLAARLVALVDTADFPQVFVRNPHAQTGIALTTHNVNRYRHPLTRAPLAGTRLAIKLARWLSLLLSCGVVFFAYQLSRTLFPHREFLALLTAALVAFNPMALFINASVNNDNLLMLLSTAALWVIVRLMRPSLRGYGWPAAGLGVLLGLTALTKLSGLALWPIAALAAGWGAWRARNLRRFFVSGALIAGPALAIFGWWALRNQRLYGDWLGLDAMVATIGARQETLTVAQLISREWQGFWLSYWGVFGSFTITPAQWVYIFFSALALVAVAGLFWRLVHGGIPKHWPELALLALFVGVTFVSLVRWTLRTPASQGRLMFGAIAPLALFMAAGLLAWFKNRQGLAAFAMVVALVAVATLTPVAYIAPRYAPPPRLTEAELPADLRPLHVTVAGRFELVGYLPDETPRRPGEALCLTLYWRALQEMERDYSLALHLLGQQMAEIGKLDTWPGAGLAATSSWRAGELLADRYCLPIPKNAETPTLARLNLAVWEHDPGDRLTILLPDGQETASVTFSVGRLAPASAVETAPGHREGSRLAGGVTLLGWDLAGEQLTLYWRTEQPLNEDLNIFLHLYAGGQRIGQADGPPLAGDWPTSAWIPGAAFADPHRLALPTNAGPLMLGLGLYDLTTGARLAAFRADGTRWPDDIIVLPLVP